MEQYRRVGVSGFNSAICLCMLEWDVNKRWQVLSGYPCYPVEIGGIGRRGKWTFIARANQHQNTTLLNPFGRNMPSFIFILTKLTVEWLTIVMIHKHWSCQGKVDSAT